MRLQPLPPREQDEGQRALHDEMAPQVEAHLKGFTSKDADGALLGPFVPMLHWPAWGRGVWAYTEALLRTTVLPKDVHEIVILVVGAATKASYELYAHTRVADDTSLSPATIATVAGGGRPPDLDKRLAAGHDLAVALTRGGPVPDAVYEQARSVLGDDGAAEIVFLVGGYAAVSVLLNGFNVPVPDDDL